MEYREKKRIEDERAERRAHKRQTMITVLVTDEERDRVNARARSLGRSLADHARELLNADLRSANLPPLRVGREPYGMTAKFISMDTIMGVGERQRPGQPKPKAVRLGELVPREPARAYTPRVPPQAKEE